MRKTAAVIIAIFGALAAHRPAICGDVVPRPTFEQRAAHVVPFEMYRSMHVFRPTPTGGLQQAVSLEGDRRQVSLIRKHLRALAVSYTRGDLADPMYVHGMHAGIVGARAPLAPAAHAPRGHAARRDDHVLERRCASHRCHARLFPWQVRDQACTPMFAPMQVEPQRLRRSDVLRCRG